MNKELQAIKRQAASAQKWYHVASTLARLCEYIAKHERIAELEERIALLETGDNTKNVVQNVDTIEEGASMTGMKIDFLG